MAIKPWNYPCYISPGHSSSDVGNDGDPYYTNTNGVADFTDNGKWCVIFAFGPPPGFCLDGHGANTSMTASSYPPIVNIGVQGRPEPCISIRSSWYEPTPSTNLLQVYTHDGSSYGVVFAASDQQCLSRGHRFEGGMHQVAISVDGPNGKVQIWINGVEYRNDTVTPFGGTNMHSTNAARMCFNAYSNWSTTSWSAGGQCSEHVNGPMLFHDDFIDLSDPAVRANIWDENGDFLWAGQDGREWLGGTIPWYFSEVGVPLHGNRGTNGATWYRPTNSAYTHWGYPAGCKEDFPTHNIPPWYAAAQAIPNVKGIFDMTGIFAESNYFLHNCHMDYGHVRRYSPSYAAAGAPPMRDHRECIGAPGYFSTTDDGWRAPFTSPGLGTLCNGATRLWMTQCLDMSRMNTGNMPFRKIIGWRSASSDSYFGLYGSYPSLSARQFTLQCKPGGVDHYLGMSIPTNVGMLVHTWDFDNGVVRNFRNGVKLSTSDLSGSGTSLPAANSTFGWFDNTSAATGTMLASCDFVAVGGGGATVSDAEHIALHTALLEGAWGRYE